MKKFLILFFNLIVLFQFASISCDKESKADTINIEEITELEALMNINLSGDKLSYDGKFPNMTGFSSEAKQVLRIALSHN